jgi:protein TonB
MIFRLGLSTGVGIVATLSLFYLMQFLIAGAENVFTDDPVGTVVNIVRVKQETQVETIDRTPKPPPPVDQPPPKIPPQTLNVSIDQAGFSITGVKANGGEGISASGFVSDGEYLPIVKVQPVYPRRAQSRGLQGWVIVEFTVSPQGTVVGPAVVNNCAWSQPKSAGPCVDSPNGVFDAAALRAVLKFKYKPKVINSEPVATAGVQNRIVFALAEA